LITLILNLLVLSISRAEVVQEGEKKVVHANF
jgi:hypothetical protein